MYSEEEIKKILKQINWDTTHSTEELYKVFRGEVKEAGSVDKTYLYHKILNGYNWYTVMKIFPREELKNVLSEEVIKRLFPQPLRDKYRYVRRVLFE